MQFTCHRPLPACHEAYKYQSKYLSFVLTTNFHAGKTFGSQSQVMDINEERRRKKRERYAQMKDEEKQEQVKKLREAYQNKKLKEPKKYAELEPEKREKIRAQERQRYADMQPEKKKARVEQIAANNVLKRGMPCKDSIAMRNPAYNATEHEGRASTLNVRQKSR